MLIHIWQCDKGGSKSESTGRFFHCPKWVPKTRMIQNISKNLNPRFYRLFMKGKFYIDLQWPLQLFFVRDSTIPNAIYVKLWQHNFTIATVVKLLTKGLCSESGLHSLPFRSSRCLRLDLHFRVSDETIKNWLKFISSGLSDVWWVSYTRFRNGILNGLYYKSNGHSLAVQCMNIFIHFQA